MPEETKGPDSVLPQPEGAKAPTETASPSKPPAAPAAESKPAEAAKPAVAAKPAAPAAAAAPKPPAAPAKPAGPVPEPWDSELVTQLRQQYGSGIVEALRYVGQTYLTVDQSILPEILRRMRDDEGFDYCVDSTAVHYPYGDKQFPM